MHVEVNMYINGVLKKSHIILGVTLTNLDIVS